MVFFKGKMNYIKPRYIYKVYKKKYSILCRFFLRKGPKKYNVFFLF